MYRTAEVIEGFALIALQRRLMCFFAGGLLSAFLDVPSKHLPRCSFLRAKLCVQCVATQPNRANGITQPYPPIMLDLVSNWLAIHMVATPLLKLRGH
jgi:hypothetical protein